MNLMRSAANGPPLRVHPRKVEPYLADFEAPLVKRRPRVRAVVQEDVERGVVHPVRAETAKPFAKAEVIASDKGLLSRVVLVVAGGRIAFTATGHLEICFVVGV
jgi:hypothetical protein